MMGVTKGNEGTHAVPPGHIRTRECHLRISRRVSGLRTIQQNSRDGGIRGAAPQLVWVGLIAWQDDVQESMWIDPDPVGVLPVA